MGEGLLIDWELTPEQNEDRQIFWAVNAYSHRQSSVAFGVQRQKFWSETKNWMLLGNSRVSRWFALGLLVNLACVALYLTLIGGVIEGLRRRKRRWYQQTLLEYGLVALGIGIILVVVLNVDRSARRKTKAMADYAAANNGSCSAEIKVDIPIWVERLTNLSFDIPAKGRWAGYVNTKAFDPASRLPYFSVVEMASFDHGISDLDKAISAVEGLRPNTLVLNVTQQPGDYSLDFLQRVDGSAVQENLQVIIRPGLGGQILDVDEDLFKQFEHLESLYLEGVGTSHLAAAARLPLKTLGLADGVDAGMLNEISKMDELESIDISVPDHFVSQLHRLPRSLRRLKLLVYSTPSGKDAVLDFRNISTLENLESLTITMPMSANGQNTNITLGRLDRFQKLSSLKLIPFSRRMQPADKGLLEKGTESAPTLGELNLEYRTLPSLSTLELGAFAFDDESLAWIKSHKNLKRLFLHRNVNPEVQDQMKAELPHVEQWR